MFVRFTGRVLINAASLNAQGGEGTNYIPVTRVPVVFRLDERYQIAEIPAVSGNMVKHYHFANFVQTFREKESFKNSFSLTADAFRGYIAYRFGRGVEAKKADSETSAVDLSSEDEIIKNFADADIHGYLAPDTQNRRESLCKFSFLLPVEEIVEQVEATSVIHNRVIVKEDGTIDREGMMPFRREYASAPFGFLMVLDLAYVGKCLSNLRADNCLDSNEWEERVTSAIYAVQEVLLGNVGASRSRAFPAIKVEELIAVESDNPIPAPVHGFYKDYSSQTAQIFKSYTNIGPKNNSVWIGLYGRDEKILNRLKEAFGGMGQKESAEKEEKPRNHPKVEALQNLGEIFSKLAEHVKKSNHKPAKGGQGTEKTVKK